MEKGQEQIDSKFTYSVENKQLFNPLKWEEINHMVEKGWGLRNSGSVDKATKEFKEGIKSGDGISLAYPNSFIPPDYELDPIYELYNFSVKNISFSKISNSIPENYHQQILEGYENAVKTFIKVGVANNIFNPEVENTSKIIENSINDNVGFIIANFQGAESPRDVESYESYYQLGKCGTQDVSKDNMIALITLKDKKDEIYSSLNLSDEELNSDITKEVNNKILDVYSSYIWESLLKTVRKEMI